MSAGAKRPGQSALRSYCRSQRRRVHHPNGMNSARYRDSGAGRTGPAARSSGSTGLGAGTRTDNMAMVVDVRGRTSVATSPRCMACSLARRSSARPSFTADCVPSPMGLHSADRGDRNPALVGMGVGHHSLGPVEQYQAGLRSGWTSHFPPADAEGIAVISGPRYSSSAASSTKSRPTWSMSRMPAERS
jgi:hypothetical protein